MATNREFMPTTPEPPARRYPQRPMALLLASLLAISSVTMVAAGKGQGPEDPYAELVTRGPHAALETNPAGKVVPKPQRDDEMAAIADRFARSLNEAVAKGWFRLDEDFRVALTPQGREFAEDLVAESSAGCLSADAVSADWTGYLITVGVSCSEEELLRRTGVDLRATPGPDTGTSETGSLIPATVQAAGFAPTAPDQPAPDALLSDGFGCIGSALAVTGSFLNIAAMVFGPWTGWVHVTLQFSARGLLFFASSILMVQNCTQLVGMRSTKSVWIARGPQLPLAMVGLGAMRLRQPVGPEDAGSATWVTVTGSCAFHYYANYRYDPTYGYSVPTYKRYNC